MAVLNDATVTLGMFPHYVAQSYFPFARSILSNNGSVGIRTTAVFTAPASSITSGGLIIVSPSGPR